MENGYKEINAEASAIKKGQWHLPTRFTGRILLLPGALHHATHRWDVLVPWAAGTRCLCETARLRSRELRKERTGRQLLG